MFNNPYKEELVRIIEHVKIDIADDELKTYIQHYMSLAGLEVRVLILSGFEHGLWVIPVEDWPGMFVIREPRLHIIGG